MCILGKTAFCLCKLALTVDGKFKILKFNTLKLLCIVYFTNGNFFNILDLVSIDAWCSRTVFYALSLQWGKCNNFSSLYKQGVP